MLHGKLLISLSLLAFRAIGHRSHRKKRLLLISALGAYIYILGKYAAHGSAYEPGAFRIIIRGRLHRLYRLFFRLGELNDLGSLFDAFVSALGKEQSFLVNRGNLN